MSRFLFATSVVVLLWGSVSVADEEAKPDKRLAFLLERADALKMEAAVPSQDPQVVDRRPTPLLRYTNPVYKAQSSGALLIWTHQDVPVALASYSIRHDKDIFRELVSLWQGELICTLENSVPWSPTKCDFPHQKFANAPAPPANERLRLVHMKRLADRIKVEGKRRLPTPLYRYSSKERGIIDGAVFSYVTANDPDALLLIEAVEAKDESPHWRFSLARMTSAQVKARLDNQPVWTAASYWDNPKTRRDPYVEQLDSALPSELRQPKAGADAGEDEESPEEPAD